MPASAYSYQSLAKLSLPRRLALVSFLFFLLFSGFLIGVLVSRGIIRVQPRALVPAPTTNSLSSDASPVSLTLVPASGTTKIGEDFTVKVNVSGGVSASDVVLTFDPNALAVQSILPGSNFPFQPKEPQINAVKGTIVVSSAVPIGTAPAAGELFSVIFRGISTANATTVSINLLGDQPPGAKTVLARNGQNMVQLAVGGSYIIE